MTLIVQKYGGSSVADASSIKRVAKRVVDTRRSGAQVVVVVSAMGDTTDDLIDLAKEVSPLPAPREMDMLLSAGERISMALLAMAIRTMGHEALSFTGSQAGMITDTHHGQARIVDVTPVRIRETINDGKVAIVAGFQGFSRQSRDITTLGRGGSDTTAVALAAALGAELCEIYTDVDGVYTADPRVVPRARLLKAVCTESMLEMAAAGAKILHVRSVEFARRHRVKLKVRSSFTSHPGTIVYQKSETGGDVEEPVVTGVATDVSEAKITLAGVPNTPGQAAGIFRIVARAKASVDNIVQNFSSKGDGLADLSFTLPKVQGPAVVQALEAARESIRFDSLQYDDQIGKITLVGAGIRGSAEIPALFFAALEEAGINIELISTSEIRISVITRADAVADAARLIHKLFELDAPDEARVHAGSGI